MHYLVDFCRFCLTFDGDFHNMSLGDILEKANTCIGDFEFYRSLPNLICTECLETLDKFFDFRNRCLQSELVVHRYVQVLTQNKLTDSFVNKKLGPRLSRSFEGGRVSEGSVEKVSLSENCDELTIASIRGFNDFEYTEDFEQVGDCDAALPLFEPCSLRTLSKSAEACRFDKLPEPVPPFLEPCSLENPPEPTYVFNDQSEDKISIKYESIKENDDILQIMSDGLKEIISETADNNIALEQNSLKEEIVNDFVPSLDNDTVQIKTEPESSDDKISDDCQKYKSIVLEKDKANLPTSNNQESVFKISNSSILAQRLLAVEKLKTYSSPKRKLLSSSNSVKRIRVDPPEESKTDKSQNNIRVDLPQENDTDECQNSTTVANSQENKGDDLFRKSETFQDNFIESTRRAAPPPRTSPMGMIINPSRNHPKSNSAKSMCITKCETKSQCSGEASSVTDFENAISLHHILSTTLQETETNDKPPVLPIEEKPKQIVKDNPAVLPILTAKDTPKLIVKDGSVVWPRTLKPQLKGKLVKTVPMQNKDSKTTLVTELFTNQGRKILLSMDHNYSAQQGAKQTVINSRPAQNAPPVPTSRFIMVKTNEWNLMKFKGQSQSSSMPVPGLRLLNSVTNDSIPAVQDHITKADTHNTVYKLNQSSLLRNKSITFVPQKVSMTQDTRTNNTISSSLSAGYVIKSINPLPSTMAADTNALTYKLSNKPIISVPRQVSVTQDSTKTTASNCATDPLRIDYVANPISPVTLTGTVATSTGVSSYKQSNNEPIIPVSNQISETQDICNTISTSPLNIGHLIQSISPVRLRGTVTTDGSSCIQLPNPVSSKAIATVSVTTDSNTFRMKADDGDAERSRTLDGQNTNLSLLPAKSRELYENNYLRFMNWRKSQNVDTFSENILIKYLTELSATVKPSTLWSHYSMLKATLHIKHGIDIKNYLKLTHFLKSKSWGYRPRTSKTLTKEQISKFLAEAPDHKYLMAKVCLMLGVAGGLRREELVRIKFEDVTELETGLLVKVYDDSGTKRHKTFKVSGDKCLQLYRKYASLRPPDIPTDRFFIKYRYGKCHRQVVGIHKIASIAQEVARYLCLPDFKEYTGHCLRKTSTEMLVKAGVSRSVFRRRGKTHISISTAVKSTSSTETETTNGSTQSTSKISTPLETSRTEPPFTLDLLPEKSRVVYEHSYARFKDWLKTRNVNSLSEDVIIDYFSDLSATVKPSTLWSHYSKVRATVNIKHDIDIKEYPKLLPFLKNKTHGYQATKTVTFTRDQINKFLSEAPDKKYLMTKVSLIFGIAGALRRDELPNIKFADITEIDNAISIKIQDVVTKNTRSFTISNDNYVKLYKKYSSLRPANVKTDRFFLKYANGACYRQVVGVHKLASTAYEVANYLHLPHSKLYTAHSLRKTSAQVLREGVDLSGLRMEEEEQTEAEFSFSTGLHIPESLTKEEVELDDLDCILDGKLDFSNETVPTDTDIQIFKTNDW